LIGVNVVDVEKGVVLENMTVKVAGGLFESIKKSKEIDMQEDGWVSVDARGLWMCPGLIDCASYRLLLAAQSNHTLKQATFISSLLLRWVFT
jgi:imidazolonepropionase-like amidohydrolase